MRVAVFGCGPAGLLAAHAAVLRGHEVEIFSRRERSHIHGAQYIHEPIPDVTGEPTVISYAKLGDSGGYAEKVYGSPFAPSSWASFPQGDYPAWPMGAVYERLWIAHERRIMTTEIDSAYVEAFMSSAGRVFDLVFNSIPARSLCQKPEEHRFTFAEVMFQPHCYADLSNIVIYSGRKSEDWYRTSSLFGHDWTEYGGKIAQAYRTTRSDAFSDTFYGIKPIETDCDCNLYPDLMRIGRFGRWSKKVLVTDAFRDAKEALSIKEHNRAM